MDSVPVARPTAQNVGGSLLHGYTIYPAASNNVMWIYTTNTVYNIDCYKAPSLHAAYKPIASNSCFVVSNTRECMQMVGSDYEYAINNIIDACSSANEGIQI